MLEELSAKNTESRVDLKWLLQNWAEISADPRYAGGYVAIKNRRIIDFDSDGNALDKRTRNPETEEADRIRETWCRSGSCG